MSSPIDPEIQQILFTKKADLSQVMLRASQDVALFEKIFDGLDAKQENYRYNCYKVVYQIGCEQPQIVYPYWDRLAAFLDSENAYHRATGVYLLPRLLAVDSDRRFDRVAERYLVLLGDTSIVVARYVAQNAATIAAFRPDLRGRVAAALLAVRKTAHNESRKDLLVSDVLDSLEQLYPHLTGEERQQTVSLAEDYLKCSSPRTRQIARALLRRFAGVT